MARYIALLRGINVSGQKLIKMEDLRRHFELPGFSNIATYIQSGNVLFDTEEKKTDVIRKMVEAALETKLGYAVPVIIRSIAEIKKAIKDAPLAVPSAGAQLKLYVSFLSAAPAAEQKHALEACSNEMEQVKVAGKQVYLLSGSYGTTRFTNAFVERKLGVQSTVRNWNTVNKILEL